MPTFPNHLHPAAGRTEARAALSVLGRIKTRTWPDDCTCGARMEFHFAPERRVCPACARTVTTDDLPNA